MKKTSPNKIDELLPQTQCGLCEYEGCMPYAKAISKGEAPINKCLPGGERVLKQLGQLLEVNIDNYVEDMRQKQKSPSVAVIDENLCIGCVKCINACPVDAIVGAGKLMHTVIESECTGCELCIEPCPMDCISMITTDKPNTSAQWAAFSDKARHNYYRKNARLEKNYQNARQQHKAKVKLKTKDEDAAKKAKLDYIKAAMERVKNK